MIVTVEIEGSEVGHRIKVDQTGDIVLDLGLQEDDGQNQDHRHHGGPVHHLEDSITVENQRKKHIKHLQTLLI